MTRSLLITCAVVSALALVLAACILAYSLMQQRGLVAKRMPAAADEQAAGTRPAKQVRQVQTRSDLERLFTQPTERGTPAGESKMPQPQQSQQPRVVIHRMEDADSTTYRKEPTRPAQPAQPAQTQQPPRTTAQQPLPASKEEQMDRAVAQYKRVNGDVPQDDAAKTPKAKQDAAAEPKKLQLAGSMPMRVSLSYGEIPKVPDDNLPGDYSTEYMVGEFAMKKVMQRPVRPVAIDPPYDPDNPGMIPPEQKLTITADLLRYDYTIYGETKDEETQSDRIRGGIYAGIPTGPVEWNLCIPLERNIFKEEPLHDFTYSRIGIALLPKYNFLVEGKHPCNLYGGPSIFHMRTYMQGDYENSHQTGYGFMLGASKKIKNKFKFGLASTWQHTLNKSDKSGIPSGLDLFSLEFHMGLPLGNNWSINKRINYSAVHGLRGAENEFTTVALGVGRAIKGKGFLELNVETMPLKSDGYRVGAAFDFVIKF